MYTMPHPMPTRSPDNAPGTGTDDETAAEEAVALLSAVDAEVGRTTDPVRMYMREMGTVELLTREGEIAIAKRNRRRSYPGPRRHWPASR